jgi:Xaa-Pro aminopeptidase
MQVPTRVHQRRFASVTVVVIGCTAVTAILLYGDTARYPAIRHEVPLEILDPILFVARDGAALVMASSLDAGRVAKALPDCEVLTADELGFHELIEEGMSSEDADLETAVRAVRRWGVERALVPADLPVAVADRMRAEGVVIDVDARAVHARRRVKTPGELAGIRRAQRAAEAGMNVAETLIREAERSYGGLHHEGEPLTAERVRAAMRAACAAAGAPAPVDVLVSSALSGGGHDPGAGSLPADLPIVIDLWPRDEESGCWADMARTFVGGEVAPEVAELRDVVREALEAARSAARPGITGRALYEIAAEIIERAGHPTQRTNTPGETLTHGFYFSLGHGVGLEVHEPPILGLSGAEPLVAGDVVAIEPGVENLEGIGGVSFEDLLLITEDGSETLTDYPYDL